MSHGNYTLLVENNDDRARVIGNTLGDAKPENPVLRARTVHEALKIIQNSGIGTIDTLVLNPTVGLLSRGEQWGALGPLYFKELKANNGRASSGPLFFSMLSSLYPNLKTEPGLIGKSNVLLTSLSPKANEETKSVSKTLNQYNTLTRQALVGNDKDIRDDEVMRAFANKTKPRKG